MRSKTIILVFATILFLSACSVQDDTKEANVRADNLMAGNPCHFMANMWMGDCLFDSEGNAIDEDGNSVSKEMPMKTE